MADPEASGCGVPGAEVALWTVGRDRILYSRHTWRWPRHRELRVDASFSSATRNGAVARRTQFAGEVFKPDGHQLPGGTRIDAYIGTTLCGVTSVQRTGSFSSLHRRRRPRLDPRLYTRLDDHAPRQWPAAIDTAVNEPGRSGSLDLTVR